ncbi:hypothetical protein HK405_002991, partial [Cladochytrium tenue]
MPSHEDQQLQQQQDHNFHLRRTHQGTSTKATLTAPTPRSPTPHAAVVTPPAAAATISSAMKPSAPQRRLRAAVLFALASERFFATHRRHRPPSNAVGAGARSSSSLSLVAVAAQAVSSAPLVARATRRLPLDDVVAVDEVEGGDAAADASILAGEARALVLFEEAKRAGHAAATGVCGFFREFGLAGLDVDLVAAESLYTVAANAGSGLAQARLAFLKMHGRPGIIIDHRVAARWSQQCRRRGESAVAWLRAGAAAGQPAAQFCLALCFYNRIGVAFDGTAAFRWCEAAARGGVAGAQNVLGNLHVEGTGCAAASARAGLRWYIRAAERKEAAAIYNIGTLFERGLGVEVDVVQALEWYRRAAAFGSVNAENILGIFCEQGVGLDRRMPSQAAHHYRTAALAGHPHAQYNLARCLHEGIGVARDDARALAWFCRAADQGHALAALSAAVCLEAGLVGPIAAAGSAAPAAEEVKVTRTDRAAAVALYTRAAAAGCPEARRRVRPLVAARVLVAARILLNARPVDPAQDEHTKSDTCPAIAAAVAAATATVAVRTRKRVTWSPAPLRRAATAQSLSQQPSEHSTAFATVSASTILASSPRQSPRPVPRPILRRASSHPELPAPTATAGANSLTPTVTSVRTNPKTPASGVAPPPTSPPTVADLPRELHLRVLALLDDSEQLSPAELAALADAAAARRATPQRL